jgi:hypothetical protein
MHKDIHSPRSLNFGEVLTLDEAKERLEEVRKILTAIQAQAGLSGNNELQLAQQYQIILHECLGTLLPLQLDPEVQAEYKQLSSSGKPAEALIFGVSDVQSQILLYLATFSNTGVRLILPDGESQKTSRPNRIRQLLNKLVARFPSINS